MSSVRTRERMARVTEEDFSAAVDGAAGSIWKVESASAVGFTAEIAFSSRSGRSSVRATLYFDSETGRCTTIVCPYQANVPRFFADEVESRLRS